MPKNDKNRQGRSPTLPTTATSKNNKDRQGRQQPLLLHTSQIPLSLPQRTHPPTNAGRLINPNNLLKVLTANVQSVSTKIDELIAHIHLENFDVIMLNETWLDTQNRHLLSEVAIYGYKVFHVDKPTPTGRGSGSIMYVKNTLYLIERKTSATSTREIIQVDVNPKNAVNLKLVLIYRNTRITAADDDASYTMLEEILQSQHECVIICVFNFPNIDWKQQRQTPAPGIKLMQLLADNNLTQHVHETTRPNNILDLVISREEELIVNLNIIGKMGDLQAIQYSIKTKNGIMASEKNKYNFRRANFYEMRTELYIGLTMA